MLITENRFSCMCKGLAQSRFYKLNVSYQDITFFNPTFLEGNGKPLSGMYIITNIHEFMHDSLKQQVNSKNVLLTLLYTYSLTPYKFDNGDYGC